MTFSILAIRETGICWQQIGVRKKNNADFQVQ